MGHRAFNLVSVLFLGLFGFGLVGCNIRFVARQTPPPVYCPNADRVGQRIDGQISLIQRAIQSGSVRPEMGAALLEMDGVIRDARNQYIDSGTGQRDLTIFEANGLETMLNDNAAAFKDAARRRQVWDRFFQGHFDIGASSPQNRRLYMVYLVYRLNLQNKNIQDAVQSGKLSRDWAQDILDRNQYIRSQVVDRFQKSRKLDLAKDQFLNMKLMARDNDEFLHYRLTGHEGHWSQDRSQEWKGFDRWNKGRENSREKGPGQKQKDIQKGTRQSPPSLPLKTNGKGEPEPGKKVGKGGNHEKPARVMESIHGKPVVTYVKMDDFNKRIQYLQKLQRKMPRLSQKVMEKKISDLQSQARAVSKKNRNKGLTLEQMDQFNKKAENLENEILPRKSGEKGGANEMQDTSGSGRNNQPALATPSEGVGSHGNGLGKKKGWDKRDQ